MVFGPWYSSHGIKVLNISKVYITHMTSTHLYTLRHIKILHYTHYIYTSIYIRPDISKFYITHITSTHLYILGPTYQKFTLHTLHLHIPIYWVVERLSAQ